MSPSTLKRWATRAHDIRRAHRREVGGGLSATQTTNNFEGGAYQGVYLPRVIVATCGRVHESFRRGCTFAVCLSLITSCPSSGYELVSPKPPQMHALYSSVPFAHCLRRSALSFAVRPLDVDRARRRLAAYLKWLEDKARRRREYQRYLAALAAQRKAGDRYSEQVRTGTVRGLESTTNFGASEA